MKWYKERFDIGRNGDIYLVRYTLWGQRFSGRYRVFLHHFLRSDYEGAFHDHPWPFVSIILKGGYWENTVRGRHWYGPGRILARQADHRHYVELPKDKECWTLVFVGQKVRSWGFWCPKGFRGWKSALADSDLGLDICGEMA